MKQGLYFLFLCRNHDPCGWVRVFVDCQLPWHGDWALPVHWKHRSACVFQWGSPFWPQQKGTGERQKVSNLLTWYAKRNRNKNGHCLYLLTALNIVIYIQIYILSGSSLYWNWQVFLQIATISESKQICLLWIMYFNT